MRLLLPFFLLFLFAACGNPAKEAAGFNDDLVDLANNCIDKQEVLTLAVKKGDCRKADSALKALAECARLAMDTLKTFTPGNAAEDKNYYAAAQKYLQSLSDLAANEYAEYCRLYCKADSLFTENDELRHAELARTINRKDSAADAAFEMAQKRFATLHQINIK